MSFMWILYAKRPLSIKELQDAIATQTPIRTRNDLDLHNINVIFEACANLIAEERGIVRPIHYSVQEFFTNPSSEALKGSCLNQLLEPTYIHQRLAQSCLYYLRLGVLDEGPEIEQLKLYWKLEDYPFLWYSARFFDHHVQSMQNLPKSVLQLLETQLHCKSSNLAALLQIRMIRNPDNVTALAADFQEISYAVDASTILYVTQLYNVAALKSQFLEHGIPKYALHLACSAGLFAAVTRLVEKGCNVNEQDHTHASPCYYACAAGHVLILELLLEQGADVNAQGGYYGNAL